jgi:hypothetical protein
MVADMGKTTNYTVTATRDKSPRIKAQYEAKQEKNDAQEISSKDSLLQSNDRKRHASVSISHDTMSYTHSASKRHKLNETIGRIEGDVQQPKKNSIAITPNKLVKQVAEKFFAEVDPSNIVDWEVELNGTKPHTRSRNGIQMKKQSNEVKVFEHFSNVMQCKSI